MVKVLGAMYGQTKFLLDGTTVQPVLDCEAIKRDLMPLKCHMQSLQGC